MGGAGASGGGKMETTVLEQQLKKTPKIYIIFNINIIIHDIIYINKLGV